MSEKENLLPRTSKKSDSEGVSRAGEWRSLQPGPTRYGSIPSQRRRLLPKFDFQRRHAWIVCIVLALGVVGIGLGLGLGLPRSSAMSSPGNVTTAASTSTSSNPPKTTRSVSSTPTSTTSPSTVTTSRTSTVSSTSSPTTTTTTTTVRTNATTTTTTSPPAVNGTAPAAAPVLNAANPRSAGAGRNSRRVDVAAPEHEPGTQKQPPRARRPQRSASAAVDASGTVRNERPLYRLPPPRRLNSFVPASDYAPLGAAAAADVASHGVSGRFKRAAVASDGKPCAQIAKRMLERGGSAVDGAVAALLCVGVVSPQSTGIGGGMVMTVYDETTGSADTLLARETAPAAARPDMFANDSDASLIGGLAVAVPGEIRGYWEAHRKYGILPWGDLFQPAIDLCENGSAVQRPLALQLQKQRDRILAEPTMSEIFVDPKTGDVLKEGDMMYRRKLGETLREIAVSGPDAFYRGSVAEKLLRDLGKFGSIITAEDLANYTAVWTPAYTTPINGTNAVLHTTTAPTSGPVLGFILKVMAGYYGPQTPYKAQGNFRNWTTAEQSLFMHRLAETFKHAYGRRANLGDPAFLADDIEFRQTMTSFADERFVNFIRSRINDSSIVNDPSHYGGKVSTEDGGTAHLSIVDEAGLAVSVTSTINYGFGALIRSPSTGIILNNEMDDFATPNATNVWGQQPSSKNYPEPGKRPLSSMCPSILVDKDTKLVKMIIGGAGGTRITTAIAYVLSLVYGGNEDPTDATAFKRLHHQLFPPYLQHEIDYPPEILDDLRARGHETKSYSTIPGSVVVSIQGAPDGTWYAVTDGRKAGDVAGL